MNGTKRVDILVSRVRDAIAAKRVREAAALAQRLAELDAEARAWSDWVIAGCHALSGDYQCALAVFRAGSEAGHWWKPPLLDDPALEPLWRSHEGALVRRSLNQSAPTVESLHPEVVWGEDRAASVLVISLHGNGPLSSNAQFQLWRQIPSCRAVVVRSRHLLAPGVAVWADRGRAVDDVASVAAAVGRTGHPVVVVGLGAGGAVAADLAARRPDLVAGAIAVAPPPVRGLSGDRPEGPHSTPRTVLGVITSARNTDRRLAREYEDWAGPHTTARHVRGLGHAFPAAFATEMKPLLEAVMSKAGG